MHGIDGPGSVNFEWSKGNPTAVPPVPATTFTEDWFNDTQRNLLAALTAAGITAVKLDATQIQKAMRILGGAELSGAPGRNLLDNPDFWLWQRGFAPAAFTGVKYTADRWRAFGNGPAGCTTCSQQHVAVGDTVIPSTLLNDDAAPPGNPMLRWVQNSNGTGVSTLEQRSSQALEATEGREVTLSVYLHVASGSVSITPEFEQSFGAGGSASVLTAGTAWTVTTTPTRFSFTVTLPAIAGKTIGAGYFLATRFKIPAGATFTINFRGAQLELGPIASSFKHRGHVADLLACQRNFFKTYERSTTPGSAAGAQNALEGQNSLTEASALGVRFPVAMQSVPTITWYTTGGTSGQVERPVGTGIAVTGTVGTGRNYSGYPQTASQATDVQGRAHMTAEAEL